MIYIYIARITVLNALFQFTSVFGVTEKDSRQKIKAIGFEISHTCSLRSAPTDYEMFLTLWHQHVAFYRLV